MKKIIYTFLLISIFSFAKTHELGFISPMQRHSPTDNVDGIRFSTVFTVNNNMKGLDLVLLASVTQGEFNGIRIGGLLNHVEKGGKIVSILNFLNDTKGRSQFVGIGNGINLNEITEGIRLSIFLNYAEQSKGLDLALVNISSNHIGTQIGLLNIAKNLKGKQFGLINYAKNSNISLVLPFYNQGN